METYLTLLYLTLEQEVALKDFFLQNGWRYCKSDLSMITDQVGPAKTPASYRTTRAIISYNLLDKVDTSSPNSKATGRKSEGQKTKQSKITTGNCAAKVEKSMALDGSELPDSDESEPLEMSTEMDDGDNDDDFADALNDAMEETLEEQIGGSSNSSDKPVTSPVKLSKRPVRKILKTAIQRSPTEVPQDNDSTSIGSGRKRRKVAMEKDVKTEVLHGEKSENEEHVSKSTELNPKQLTKNQAAEQERKNGSLPGFLLKCTDCEKLFKFKCNLDKHFEAKHNSDTKTTEKKKCRKRSEERTWQCDLCGAVFRRSDGLKEHNRGVHLGIRKNVSAKLKWATCDECGKTFTRRDHLKEHMLVKHSQEALPVKCDLCDQTFIRKRFLDSHMSKVHLKAKPYKCSHCDQRFYSSFYAERHKKDQVCLGKVVPRFKCTHCDSKFKDARTLEMHMTALHFGGAYSCVCGRVVKWSGSVAKHKRRCKTYQQYRATVGEVEDDRVCNIIEVPYQDVVVNEISEQLNVDRQIIEPNQATSNFTGVSNVTENLNGNVMP